MILQAYGVIKFYLQYYALIDKYIEKGVDINNTDY